jgi:hypothetical protein
MNLAPESFFDRLQLVLGGRPPTTWALRVGWNKAAIHAVTRGHVPGPEKLLQAARAENLSLDWWLDGIGRPYRVRQCRDPKEAVAEVQALRAEGLPWDVHVVRAGARAALVLTVAEQVLVELENPLRQIMYTRVEVVVGGITEEVIRSALPMPPFLRSPPYQREARGYEVSTTPERLTNLEEGRLGAFLLTGCGWEELDGLVPLLDSRQVIEDPDAFIGRTSVGVAESNTLFLTADEHRLLEHYRRLAPPQRESVGSIVEAMAVGKGG